MRQIRAGKFGRPKDLTDGIYQVIGYKSAPKKKAKFSISPPYGYQDESEREGSGDRYFNASAVYKLGSAYETSELGGAIIREKAKGSDIILSLGDD